MKMTDRDMRILEFLTQVRIATTKQIQEVFFKELHHSICYRRLKYLVDCKLVKRTYFNIGDCVNAYVYYLDKKPSKKNLKHDLLITEFAVNLKRQGFNLLEFERTPIMANIVPDAIVSFERPKHQDIKKIFLEVQLSSHDCITKYYNIKSKVNKDIPNTLYIVSDKKISIHELKDLRVVIDGIDFKKLKFYFS